MADMYGYQSAIQNMNQREQAVQESNDLKQANNLTATDDYNKEVAEKDVMNDLNLGKDFATQLFSGGAVKGAYDARNKRVAKEAKRLKALRLGGIPEEPAKPSLISRGISRVGDAITDAITNPSITPTGVGAGSAIGGGVSAPTAPTATTDPDALDEMGNRINPPPIPTTGAGIDAGRPPPPIPTTGAGVDIPDDRSSFSSMRSSGGTDYMGILGADPLPRPNYDLAPPPPIPTTGAGVDPPPIPRYIPPAPPPPIPTTGAGIDAGKPPPIPTTGAGIIPDEPEPKPEQGLTEKIIGGITGASEETSELIGRVGGAISSGAMGGLSIYDDVDNLVKSHGKHLFNKNATGADDYNNITSTIASVSDVVGLIPGAEWVAGLGNLIGESGNIVKLFGDHDKQAHNAPTKPLPETLTAVPTNTGQIADVGVQSAIKVGGLNTY